MLLHSPRDVEGNVNATISAKIFTVASKIDWKVSPAGSCCAERRRGALVKLFDGIKEKMSCSEQGSIICLSVDAEIPLDCETPQ